MSSLLLQELKVRFAQIADASVAAKQKAYLRDQFPFVGIKTTPRRELQKSIFKKYSFAQSSELIDAATLLWNQDEREFQYAAMDLIRKNKHLIQPDIVPLLEMMIRTKSWWDTVDDIAANILGKLVYNNRATLFTVMDTWITDEYLWIRRSALLCQLTWKQNTVEQKLFDFCIQTMHEKDFFIRKAVGWVLRHYARTNPIAVKRFVAAHEDRLSGLSKREAMKHIQ